MRQDHAHEAVGGRVVGAGCLEQFLAHERGCAVVGEAHVKAQLAKAELEAGRVLVRA